MLWALAKNREIDEAHVFLNNHEMDLMGEGLYDAAQETIDDVQKIIVKEQQ